MSITTILFSRHRTFGSPGIRWHDTRNVRLATGLAIELRGGRPENRGGAGDAREVSIGHTCLPSLPGIVQAKADRVRRTTAPHRATLSASSPPALPKRSTI